MVGTVTKAQPRQPFRFFSLPRELRDAIYDEVWPVTPQLYRAPPSRRSPHIDITADYRKKGPGWTTASRIPPCMLVSRAFLHEALDQYFRNIDWTARIPASYFTTRIFLSNSGFHTGAALEVEWELDSVANGTKIVPWIDPKEYSKSVVQVYQGWPMTLPILHKFDNGLGEQNGERVLYVAFGIDFGHTKGDIQIDLSSLEYIGFRLDRLVVGVRYRRPKSRWSEGTLAQLVEAEVKRLGGAMIGQAVGSKFSSGLTGWKFEITKA